MSNPPFASPVTLGNHNHPDFVGGGCDSGFVVRNGTPGNGTPGDRTPRNGTPRNGTLRCVTVELLGPDGAPGEVPATDVARLVLGVQAVIRRAAHVVLGRPRLATYGRYEADIEGATRLRLDRVERGACVFALPDIERDEGELEVDVGAHDLGYRALHQLMDVLQEQPVQVEHRLARAVSQLADDVNVGGRTGAIRFRTDADAERAGRLAVVDENTRFWMQEAAHQPRRRQDMVHGRLVEADFERNQARLRQPGGEAATVTFDDDLADGIQAVLREPNLFVGEVTFNQRSGHAVHVALRRIVAPNEQLMLPGMREYDEPANVPPATR